MAKVAARYILPFLLLGISQPPALAQLKLVQTIPLPDVEGRIDHMAVDVSGKRLFVAALGNNTLEVIDLRAGKRIHSVRGMKEPQGVAFAPDMDRIFVSNGQGADVVVLDGRDYHELKRVAVGDDPDNVRFDRAHGQALVGYGSGALQFLNPKTFQAGDTMKFEGHPESFQLTSDGQKCYVNVPDGRRVDVCEPSRPKPIASWHLTGAAANFPMALDEAHHRLFIGCRKPPLLLVIDTTSGKQVASLEIGADTDDVFYDPRLKRLYVSCGSGEIDVFHQDDADRYKLLGQIKTAAGARTSLFAAELGQLYVAVPHRGDQGAEIRVYQTR